METSWLDLVSAAAGGGLFVKALDIAFSVYSRRSEARQSATDVVARHMDPILKAADELVGKFCSLARSDFVGIQTDSSQKLGTELGNVLFLFAQLWARVEILRMKSLYVQIARDETGSRLRDFTTCLESTGVRIVDRGHQRAIGECLIRERPSGDVECIGFSDFMAALWSDEATEIQNWISPLQETLVGSNTHGRAGSRQRQKLLLYGVVVHAMVDTLDRDHETTSDRPSYPNKLSKASRRDLTFRVFKQYLPFVEDVSKYTGGSVS